MSDDRRRDWVVGFDSESYFQDHITDIALDAVDHDGLHKSEVARALREAADEVDEHTPQRDEPDRSEPADFGGGESTGVQEL